MRSNSQQALAPTKAHARGLQCLHHRSLSPSPNDNHDTMCADWQGTRLAVNQKMPSLTVITEAGAAAQTPFLTVFWEVKSDFKINFRQKTAFATKFKEVLGHPGPQLGAKTLLENFLSRKRAARKNHANKNGVIDGFSPLARTFFPRLSVFGNFNFYFLIILIFLETFLGTS